jgi:hypothetical protein
MFIFKIVQKRPYWNKDPTFTVLHLYFAMYVLKNTVKPILDYVKSVYICMMRCTIYSFDAYYLNLCNRVENETLKSDCGSHFVIKINVEGADPAPYQKLPGLGPDNIRLRKSAVQDLLKIDIVRDTYDISCVWATST